MERWEAMEEATEAGMAGDRVLISALEDLWTKSLTSAGCRHASFVQSWMVLQSSLEQLRDIKLCGKTGIKAVAWALTYQ